MQNKFKEIISGYRSFKTKYAASDTSLMSKLASKGQSPAIMMVSCCDSRADPAIILQCDPGELFVVRNVANIIPPYENDEFHHGTSSALEFGICYLKVEHLIIMGHSQCGGVHAMLHSENLPQNDFISNWVCLIKESAQDQDINKTAQQAILQSCHNALTFPWIKERINQKLLMLHAWYFDIQAGTILYYEEKEKAFVELGVEIRNA